MNVTIHHKGLVLDCTITTWPASRGKRDSMGVPEEPDEDAGFDVDSVTVTDIEDDLNVAEITAILEDENAIYMAVADELAGWEPDYE